MPLKPVKRGFKVWVRADAWNGYFCELEVYTGKAEDGTTECNLGERVVLKLTEKIAGLNHQVFIDRYFTSVRLFSTLLERKVYACGTIIASRKSFPDELKAVTDLEHGQYVFRQAERIIATAWKDKKIVYAVSNMCDPDISQPVSRKQKDGTVKLVDCPSTIVAYNKYMGGVDCGDQLQSYYRVRLKSRKFYRYVFWFLFDVVITNTYILSHNHEPRATEQAEFEVASSQTGQAAHRQLLRLGLGDPDYIHCHPSLSQQSHHRQGHCSTTFPARAAVPGATTAAGYDVLHKERRPSGTVPDVKASPPYVCQVVLTVLTVSDCGTLPTANKLSFLCLRFSIFPLYTVFH